MIKTLTLLLSLALSTCIYADTLQGVVIGVSDGDTITVLNENRQQFKIRLMGIDAPEIHQAFGERSKQSLSGLVYQKQVTVSWSKQDRYKRILGKVSVGNTDANLEQVKMGMAWFYKHYERDLNSNDRVTYSSTEEVARVSKIGLWVDADPVAPWDFRRGSKQSSRFECGAKKMCSEMTSCEEAKLYLQCGVKSLDRDKDGVPCESLCK